MTDPAIPDSTTTEPRPTAALDSAHVGDILGALGTIRLGDESLGTGVKARLTTLLAVVGPGLIVMAGDNDAGAFSTYAEAAARRLGAANTVQLA